MAEFALAAPVLVLLLFGLTYAAFYGFRAAAADWGVFITGVAEGVYDAPATGQALLRVPWADIRGGLAANPLAPEERQVRSWIFVYNKRPLTGGFAVSETHAGSSFFRLWRFYAGPPLGAIE
jgi:hypothetical protein